MAAIVSGNRQYYTGLRILKKERERETGQIPQMLLLQHKLEQLGLYRMFRIVYQSSAC